MAYIFWSIFCKDIYVVKYFEIQPKYCCKNLHQGLRLGGICFLQKQLCIVKPHCLRPINPLEICTKFVKICKNLKSLGEILKNLHSSSKMVLPNSKLPICKVHTKRLCILRPCCIDALVLPLQLSMAETSRF